MNKARVIRQGLWAAVIGTALNGMVVPVSAQTAKVAASSVRYVPDAAKSTLAVEFRLMDALSVTSVRAAAEGGEEVPTTWEAFDGDKAPACAWLVVVDVSDPKRGRAVAKGVEFVKAFVGTLPKQDQVSVCALARDLVEVVPFGGTPADAAGKLDGIKVTGDAALSTLIYQNMTDGLGRFKDRKEPRKALLLLTDGKDETPGGAPAQEIGKNKLIKAATEAGVVMHLVGYAESPADQAHFGALKELAAATDGVFVAASVAEKSVPAETSGLLSGVMHGAGTAHLDLSKLAKPTVVVLTIKTAMDRVAELSISEKEVAAVVKVAETADAEAEAAKKKADDEAAAEEAKKAEEAKQAELAQAAAKAEETKKAIAEEKAKAAKAEEAKKKKLWLGAGGGVLLAILVTAALMVRASRRRAAEARFADEEQAAQEERRAEAARRQAEEAKKPESPPLAWLEMCDAQQTRHPVRIPNLKIGRGQHNDFVLRNDSVSGNHCVLNCNREGAWTITDLNSGNGVILNGTQVVQAGLHHGDTIELGELKMRFLLRA